MSRLAPVGAVSLLVAAVVGLGGCGGSDSSPPRDAATVTQTVTESTAPPSSEAESPATAPHSSTPSHRSVRPMASSAPAEAASVVREYFAAINAQDYRRAWDLGGEHLAGSYAAFEDGLSTTALDTVHILRADGDTVSVRLEATQTDGSVRVFNGTYTVRGGVIVAADVSEATEPERKPETEPTSGDGSPYYENCAEATAAGVAPMDKGEPGYAPHLDADGDGVACEPYP